MLGLSVARFRVMLYEQDNEYKNSLSCFFDIWEDRSIVGKEFDLSEIVRDREILIFTKY